MEHDRHGVVVRIVLGDDIRRRANAGGRADACPRAEPVVEVEIALELVENETVNDATLRSEES
jgi:hypothetical protein